MENKKQNTAAEESGNIFAVAEKQQPPTMASSRCILRALWSMRARAIPTSRSILTV